MVTESRGESLRRRNIERLIGLIYAETDAERRQALVNLLAEQETEPPRPDELPEHSLRRENIERLIEMIYNETDSARRQTLIDLLTEAEAPPTRRGRSRC